MTLDDRRRLWRDRMAARRTAARAEGVCIRCTVRDATPGRATCFACRLRRSERRRATGHLSELPEESLRHGDA